MPMQLTSIKKLNEKNYKDWAKSLELYLVITNLDLALKEDQPIVYANFTLKKLRVKLEN